MIARLALVRTTSMNAPTLDRMSFQAIKILRMVSHRGGHAPPRSRPFPPRHSRTHILPTTLAFGLSFLTTANMLAILDRHLFTSNPSIVRRIRARAAATLELKMNIRCAVPLRSCTDPLDALSTWRSSLSLELTAQSDLHFANAVESAMNVMWCDSRMSKAAMSSSRFLTVCCRQLG